LSIVNGLVYVIDGAAKPQIGSVPREAVLQRGKLVVWRVRRPADEVFELGHDEFRIPKAPQFAVPILVIPPLMVRPFVYDLRPDHSMLRTLRNAGFDVFYVDFGVPDKTDEELRLDDYVVDFIPASIQAVLDASGAKELSLVGYCMGGIFALLHVATFGDTRVRNIVTIAAPVDFEKMGILTVAARLGAPFVDALLNRMGNVPGLLSSTSFKLMSGTRAVTKWAGLLANLYDEEYVRGFDSIATWLGNMIPYPREAFRQMLHDVVAGNKMLKNELTFGDRQADMKRVMCPLLAFTGRTDNIATPASTAGILELVGSTDKSYREVVGGHIGVVAGSTAPKAVWQPTVEWLKAHL
jgi:polyhydroxyalkanoate synthase